MTTFQKRSFAGGELSPAFHGRVDLEKYQTGLKTCLNCFIEKGGGASNRPGTEYITPVKTSSDQTRLLKFVYNDAQTYVIEAGNGYLRFIKSGVQVTVSGVSAWVTSTAYVVGALVSNGGTNYYCILDHTSGASTEPGVGGSWQTAWYALTGSIYEIPTPYSAAEALELKYTQSGDVLVLVHPSYAPRKLTRTADTTWTLESITFEPSIAAPTNLSASGTAGGNSYDYQVTAVKDDSYEESLPDSYTLASVTAPSTNDHTITWTAVSGAAYYNVYRKDDAGVYSFIGTSQSTTFVHNTQTLDPLQQPPTTRNPFASTDNYPSAVGIFQQRLSFGNTNTDIDKIWTSRTGFYYNLSQNLPVQQDDGPITFRMASKKVQPIVHLLELGKPLVFTAGGEWSLEGDSAGTLTPAEVNPAQHGYSGSGDLVPLPIEDAVLFLQARGSYVRFLAFSQASQKFVGGDLSLFAGHLVRGYTLTDWDYQEVPNSIVWAVRSDGTLLGCTFIGELELFGWHKHTTGASGSFENVIVVPEGQEDALYAVVKRTVNAATVRYIERLTTRPASTEVFDIEEDCKFVDSFKSYDGTNLAATTMTLSGGTTWAYTETLTLTASASYFSAGDVGNGIVLTNGTDEVLFTIEAFSSATVVTGKCNVDTPASLRNTAVSTWGYALKTITDLSHLEGLTLSCIGDGFVTPQVTVASGSVTLDRPYVKITIGIPYNSDIELLDIDTIEGETLKNKAHNIQSVTLQIRNTRGLFAGPDASHLKEYKQRASEAWNQPIAAETGVAEIPLQSTWNSNGRVLIRQSDPLPMTILGAFPEGYITTTRQRGR